MFSSNQLLKLLESFFTDRKSNGSDKNVSISFGRNFVCQNNVIGRSKENSYNEKKAPETAFVNKITVDASCFDVNITTANVSGVEAILKGNTSTPDKIEFTADVVESELAVKAKIKSGSFCGDLSLDIVLPREQRFKEISVVTSTGDVLVCEKVLVNALSIDVSSGEIDVTNFHGFEFLKIKTSTGDVSVHDEVDGGALQINTSAGEVTVCDNISTGNVEIATSTGDIEISGNVTVGNLKITTSSGEVELEEIISKGYINVKTNIGDISAESTKANSFSIDTSSGEVCLDAEFLNADIKTTTGDVEVYAFAKNNIGMVITTGAGEVSIELENIGKLTQTVKTSCGDVDCNYSRRGEYSADIKVTTSTGDIEIS